MSFKYVKKIRQDYIIEEYSIPTNQKMPCGIEKNSNFSNTNNRHNWI